MTVLLQKMTNQIATGYLYNLISGKSTIFGEYKIKLSICKCQAESKIQTSTDALRFVSLLLKINLAVALVTDVCNMGR